MTPFADEERICECGHTEEEHEALSGRCEHGNCTCPGFDLDDEAEESEESEEDS